MPPIVGREGRRMRILVAGCVFGAERFSCLGSLADVGLSRGVGMGRPWAPACPKIQYEFLLYVGWIVKPPPLALCCSLDRSARSGSSQTLWLMSNTIISCTTAAISWFAATVIYFFLKARRGGEIVSRMSSDLDAADMLLCCASCGTAEGDDIKLKTCNACKSVRYCSVTCQREHRPQHKRACKKKAAELRDEILFKQPESSHIWDCPICLIPLSLDLEKCSIMTCCSKFICNGCDHANKMREVKESLPNKCPFCRHLIPKTNEEMDANSKRRIEANDPVAINELAKVKCHEGDYSTAFEYCVKAAELGDIEAHYELSVLYREGQGVERDKKKELYHLEEAAIGWHAMARFNIGCYEQDNDRTERAVKHFIIAAHLGDNAAVEVLHGGYAAGIVRKEDFAAALRAHQAAVDATKSPQREAAEKFNAAARAAGVL
jgi:hypothetical protein